MGLRFPPSYIQFVNRFGYGRLCELFLVYVPLGGEFDSLELRWAEIGETIRESLEADLVEFPPDGSVDLVRGLCPFGVSENGHTVAWDPSSHAEDGELDIYMMGNKMLSVTRVGRSMREFVRAVSSADVKRVLGIGYEPLPICFRPLGSSGRRTAGT